MIFHRVAEIRARLEELNGQKINLEVQLHTARENARLNPRFLIDTRGTQFELDEVERQVFDLEEEARRLMFPGAA